MPKKDERIALTVRISEELDERLSRKLLDTKKFKKKQHLLEALLNDWIGGQREVQPQNQNHSRTSVDVERLQLIMEHGNTDERDDARRFVKRLAESVEARHHSVKSSRKHA